MVEIDDKQKENETQLLKVWLENLVQEYRKFCFVYTKEKLNISGGLGYFAPLSIEIFWQKDPALQLLFFYHPKNGKDLQIIVNGPYEKNNVNEEISEVLQSERWKKIAEDINQQKINEHIAEIWHQSVSEKLESLRPGAKTSMEPEDGFIFPKLHLGSIYWVLVLSKNISTLDQTKVLSLMKWKLKFDIDPTPEDLEEEIEELKTNFDCFGTYIYPPVQIGEQKYFELKDILQGNLKQPKKIIDKVIRKIPIIVYDDGQIIIGGSQKNDVLQLLNALMGLLLVFGYKTHSIRRNDVFGVTMDIKTHFIRSFDYPENPTRKQIAKDRWSKHYEKIPNRTTIKLEHMKVCVNNLDSLSNAQMDIVSLLTESHTLFSETQYSLSFIISWLIIEKFLYEMWNNSTDISPKDKKKSSVNDILKSIKKQEKITMEDYEKLNEFRKLRNNYVHRGEPIPMSESMRCFDYSSKLVRERYL